MCLSALYWGGGEHCLFLDTKIFSGKRFCCQCQIEILRHKKPSGVALLHAALAASLTPSKKRNFVKKYRHFFWSRFLGPYTRSDWTRTFWDEAQAESLDVSIPIPDILPLKRLFLGGKKDLFLTKKRLNWKKTLLLRLTRSLLWKNLALASLSIKH